MQPKSGPSHDISPLPPHDVDAERAVLGAILLNAAALAEVRPVISPPDFFVSKHREIFQAMLDLDNRDVPVDFQTVVSEFVRSNRLADIGGPIYLSDLSASVPTSTNAHHYAETVRDRSDLRRTIDTCVKSIASARSGALARDLLIDLQSRLDDISQRRHERGIQSTEQLYAEYQTYWNSYLAGDAPPGLRTGISFVDKWIPSGIEQDMTVTIGARPSDGKSAFVQNLLVNIGILHGPGLLCSVEEKADRVMRRLHRICASHQEMLRAWEAKDTAARDRVLVHALERLKKVPLFIDDSNRYIEDLRYSIKAHVMRHPETTFIAFDYFQLIRSKNERLIGREKYDYILDQIMEIKHAVRRPIVILSQFRKEQIDPQKGPHLGLLKETGRLEADSDIAILLWDPYRDEDKDKGIMKEQTELVVDIAKNRDARPKKVRLRWLKLQYLILSPGEGQTIFSEGANPQLFKPDPAGGADPMWDGKPKPPRELHPDEYPRQREPGEEPLDETPETEGEDPENVLLF